MANNNRGHVPEQERCKGTSRQSKQRCKRRRSPGSVYCIYHGSRVRKGGAHHNFKHGRRSKYALSPEMLQRHLRLLNDPHITHHRDSLTLIDALINEALEDMEEVGTPALWRDLRTAWRRVEKARARGNAARLEAALDEVGLLIGRGADQTQAIARAVNLLERRRKHAVAETKRRLAEDGTISVETAAAFYAALGAAARKHFSHDRPALHAFLQEVTVIGGGAVPETPR